MGDIFPQFEISEKMNNIVRYMDIDLSEIQFEAMNKMIKYIENNVYFGDAFHTYKKNQINANSFWLSTFYPKNEKDLVEKRNSIRKEVDFKLKQNMHNINAFTNSSTIVF